MKTPRIAFVNHTAVLGGGELCLRDLVLGWARTHSDSNCSVLLFEDGPLRHELEAHGLHVQLISAGDQLFKVRRFGTLFRVLFAVPSVLHLIWRLSRVLRHYDVVVANSQKALVGSSIASLMARKPLVWYLHDIITASHFGWLQRKVALALANLTVSSVLVNSKATAESFRAAGGRVPAMDLIYSAVDERNFPPSSSQQGMEWPAHMGIARGQSVVGIFSRIAEWKGQHVLIEALKHLPDVHAVLVGDAIFQGDCVYKERLEKLAKDPLLSGRVHFLGFQSNVAELLGKVDMVAHTSTSPEPFGRVIVEGMFAERPVVAAAAGGALEIIEHDETGLLVQPHDPQALAQALMTLRKDREKAGSIARAGRISAIARFGLHSMVEKFSSSISKVVLCPTS